MIRTLSLNSKILPNKLLSFLLASLITILLRSKTNKEKTIIMRVYMYIFIHLHLMLLNVE